MRAMILAAGLGTRLRPVTDTIPKPLLPAVGIPNIVLILMRLRRAGIREIVVNTHWLPNILKAHLGDGAQYDVTIAYSDEKELLGTGGGIKNALSLLGDDDFIVINGDALFSPDIVAATSFHRQTRAHATLIVRKDPNAKQYGAVGFDNRGQVRKLVYGGGHDHSGLTYDMFTGVHILSKHAVERLPDSGCIVRDTYIPMVEENAPIYALEMGGYFCDLGTVDRYLSANIDLVTGRVSIPDLHVPSNGVFIGDNCQIDARAHIAPGTIICDGVSIEGPVQIERTVILDNAWVNQNISNAVVTSEGVVVPR